MADQQKPLLHNEMEADDDVLRAEARAHLARHPELQLVAELLGKLRSLRLPWWSPELLRATWPAKTRMRWFRQRPDVRQVVTTRLAGLPPNATRKRSLEFQADLIDAVIDDGDVRAETFEEAFDPADLALYGPASEFWAQFRDRMPWYDDSSGNQKLVAWLIRALLTDRSTADGVTRRPILTAWEVRSGIDATAWFTRLPLEVHLAIDEARLKHEKTRPREGFLARHELAIATPEILTANLPLTALTAIFAAAEKAMGFATNVDVSSQRPSGEYDVGPSSLSNVA